MAVLTVLMIEYLKLKFSIHFYAKILTHHFALFILRNNEQDQTLHGRTQRQSGRDLP